MNTTATYWADHARRLLDEAGGHAYESLAVDMCRILGWNTAHTIARLVGYLTDADDTSGDVRWVLDAYGSADRPLHGTAYDLYARLGWAQSTLLVGWFRNLGNYRMVRDTFPAVAV